MSWHFLQGQEAASWEGICLDGAPSGMMFAIAISLCQRKMEVWTKNTDMAKSANARSAAMRSSHETRIASNNAAQTLVVAFFKHGRRLALALSAGKHFCRLAQNTKRAPANAEQHSGYRAGSSIQWSKCETGLPFSVALLSQDALEIRQTGLPRCLGIRWSNYGRTLRRISRPECHGKTTAKGWKNGA